MKSTQVLLVASALVAMAAAQAAPYREVFSEFGSCTYTDCADAAAACCGWEAVNGTRPGQKSDFCMTDAQRGTGKIWTGKYVDASYTQWEWTCPQAATPTKPVALNQEVATPYGRDGTEWVEWLIAVMYGSGIFWVLGAPVYIVLGSVVYGFYFTQKMIATYRFMSVQWFDSAVEGTLEQDKEVYTFANLMWYPYRKFMIFE